MNGGQCAAFTKLICSEVYFMKQFHNELKVTNTSEALVEIKPTNKCPLHSWPQCQRSWVFPVFISSLLWSQNLQNLNFYCLEHTNSKDSGSKSNIFAMIPSFILQLSLAPPPNTIPTGHLILFSKKTYFTTPPHSLFFLLPLMTLFPNVVLSTSKPLGNPGVWSWDVPNGARWLL